MFQDKKEDSTAQRACFALENAVPVSAAYGGNRRKKIAGSLAVVENLSVSRQICINADTGNKASVYELVGFLAKLHGIRRLHKLVQGIAYRHMEQAAVKRKLREGAADVYHFFTVSSIKGAVWAEASCSCRMVSDTIILYRRP